MITFRHGDILKSKADVLVVPVNMVGVMGAGLAAQFADAYPTLRNLYTNAIRSGKLKLGQPALVDVGYRLILLFPTKDDYKSDSKMEWITAGLHYIVQTEIYFKVNINSIAFPLLGTGLGHLDKLEVMSAMVNTLCHLRNVVVEIYQ